MGWFHPVHNMEREASKLLHMAGGRLTKFRQHPGPIMYGHKSGPLCRKGRIKKKDGVGYRKTEARQCSKVEWDFLSQTPKSWSFKDTMKNARKKLEVPLESAMLCKISNQRGETWCIKNIRRRSRCACIVEAHESTRTRVGTVQPRDHEDLIAEKGLNS